MKIGDTIENIHTKAIAKIISSEYIDFVGLVYTIEENGKKENWKKSQLEDHWIVKKEAS